MATVSGAANANWLTTTRGSLSYGRRLWMLCVGAGMVGVIAMFLPAAEVEIGLEAHAHSIVPIRDSFAFAAIPTAVSLSLIICGVVALRTDVSRIALIVGAMAIVGLGGTHGLNMAAGFKHSDRGPGSVKNSTSRGYGQALFDELVVLSERHATPVERQRLRALDRPRSDVSADVFWSSGWSFYMGAVLGLSVVLVVRLLWRSAPLWQAAVVGAIGVPLGWMVFSFVMAINRGAVSS